MNTIAIIGATTPLNMIEKKYEKAKKICLDIWDRPKSRFDFEDIFHDTIYRCLNVLGDEKLDQEYMKCYFFKAFRINMVRYFGYAFNSKNSGKDIEDIVIPVESDYNGHIDGFGMIDLVEKLHGKEVRDVLWDNLCGFTYKELDRKYDTNTFYLLSKIKNELKSYYREFIYNRIRNKR